MRRDPCPAHYGLKLRVSAWSGVAALSAAVTIGAAVAHADSSDVSVGPSHGTRIGSADASGNPIPGTVEESLTTGYLGCESASTSASCPQPLDSIFVSDGTRRRIP